MSLANRIVEFRLRNNTDYDDRILVEHDGDGWTTWVHSVEGQNGTVVEGSMLTILEDRVVNDRRYVPVVEMPYMWLSHRRSRRGAVLLGRRLVQEEARREKLKTGPQAP